MPPGDHRRATRTVRICDRFRVVRTRENTKIKHFYIISRRRGFVKMRDGEGVNAPRSTEILPHFPENAKRKRQRFPSAASFFQLLSVRQLPVGRNRPVVDADQVRHRVHACAERCHGGNHFIAERMSLLRHVRNRKRLVCRRPDCRRPPPHKLEYGACLHAAAKCAKKSRFAAAAPDDVRLP